METSGPGWGHPAVPFDDRSGDPPVRGTLQGPVAHRDALVLTHGAGSDADAPLLVVVADAFAAAGISVLRCDLPFRQARRRGPPRVGEADRDRAGLRHAVAALHDRGAGRVVLGGQSYGGRQASMLAAADPGLIDGLLLLSYPLHPPGRPTAARIAHFPDLRVPVLFVHGTADPFGTLEELRGAAGLIPAPTRIIALEHAGHDLRRGRGLRERLLPGALTFFGFART